MDSSKNTLDIAIYMISRQSITDAILRAKTRGVDVRLITDIEMCTRIIEINKLYHLTDKIPIKVDTHEGSMHLKLVIEVNFIIATGTYNYTDRAINDNAELLLVIASEEMALGMLVEYNKLWKSIITEYRWTDEEWEYTLYDQVKQ
ncbi:phospholipase D-like domain-containing protein [Clostridium estertheticum]|uniref:phospholipase D-like domain-containing protein n=1 Tax=Clostridium estertheticum TaxID=238834 RepID=UPI002815F94C|nr:phospholipase D-like domain-containing protein [Clostridium estertheticum]